MGLRRSFWHIVLVGAVLGSACTSPFADDSDGDDTNPGNGDSLGNEVGESEISAPKISAEIVQESPETPVSLSWEPVEDAVGYVFIGGDVQTPFTSDVCDGRCEIRLGRAMVAWLDGEGLQVASIDSEGRYGPVESIEGLDQPLPEPLEPNSDLWVVSVTDSDSENRVVSSVQVSSIEQAQDVIAATDPETTKSGVFGSAELHSSPLAQSGPDTVSGGPVAGGTARAAVQQQVWPNKGKGVTIAVLDGGIDPNHPAFFGADILPGINLTDDQKRPGTDVPSEHGNAVASVIVGRGTIVGYAPDATILPVDLYDGRPNPSPDRIASGIYYAADNGADMLVISIGIPCYQLPSPDVIREKLGDYCRGAGVLQDAINYAESKGAIVVVSGGNNGDGGDFCKGGTYAGIEVPNDLAIDPANGRQVPASLDGVIAVGFTDSVTGEPHPCNSDQDYVDVLAPGRLVPVATLNGYGLQSGSSFSAPLVAAFIATILAENPELTASQIESAIKACASAIGHINTLCTYQALEIELELPPQNMDFLEGGPVREMDFFVRLPDAKAQIGSEWETGPVYVRTDVDDVPNKFRITTSITVKKGGGCEGFKGGRLPQQDTKSWAVEYSFPVAIEGTWDDENNIGSYRIDAGARVIGADRNQLWLTDVVNEGNCERQTFPEGLEGFDPWFTSQDDTLRRSLNNDYPIIGENMEIERSLGGSICMRKGERESTEVVICTPRPGATRTQPSATTG